MHGLRQKQKCITELINVGVSNNFAKKGSPLKMTWSVILWYLLKGWDKIFQRGLKISSRSGPGVHFLGGPNILYRCRSNNSCGYLYCKHGTHMILWFSKVPVKDFYFYMKGNLLASRSFHRDHLGQTEDAEFDSGHNLGLNSLFP